MDNSIKIPTIYDKEECAKLIYMSGPSLFDYMTKLTKKELDEFFYICLTSSGNFYSEENIRILEEDNIIQGLMVSYPFRDAKVMSKNMGECGRILAKKLGLLKMIRMIPGMTMNFRMPKINDDEYFIASLAVYEHHRNKGVASRLMIKAEELAIRKDCKKMSLTVENDNYPAIDLYKKFGFVTEKVVTFPKRFKKHNLVGCTKMIREL